MPHATIKVGLRAATLVAMAHMVTRIPLSGSITDAEQHLQYVQVLTYTLAQGYVVVIPWLVRLYVEIIHEL